MKYLFSLLCFGLFIFTSCNTHYVPSGNKSASKTRLSKKQTVDEDGYCWQDCLMPSIYEDEVTSYNIYTGDAAIEDVELEEIVIEIGPRRTQWVKKRPNRDCVSHDPNDCLVWCLVEVPGATETFMHLKDTSQSPNFEVKEIIKKILIKKGGYVEKQKVICDDKLTVGMVTEVQQLLNEKKYDTGAPTQKLNALLKSSLNKYQQDNNLPVGLLNFQTLDKLGVVQSR